MKKIILSIVTATILAVTLTACGGGGSTTTPTVAPPTVAPPTVAPPTVAPPTVAPTYKITSFSPASGTVGTVILITGTDFPPTATVKLNGVDAAITASTTTQITVTVPATADTGLIEIKDGTKSVFTTSVFIVTPP